MSMVVTGILHERAAADLLVEHLVQEAGIPRDLIEVHRKEEGGAAARSPQDALRSVAVPSAQLDALPTGAILVAARIEAPLAEKALCQYREAEAEDIRQLSAK
ncbi:hypothetical protein IAI18_07705 [Acetobacteraceae bacterium H6797]|nr:hypothetical protein [Acetobacteraceae bacterium H6797]